MPGNNGTVTTAYIAFHAAERPDAVAIINNGRSITYAEFARDIRKITHALRALDLPQGSKAAINSDDAYFNWLLTLAFEQLKVVTALVALPDIPDALQLVRHFDVVLSGKSFPAGAVRHHPTTTAWLQSILESGKEDREPAPEKRPDDPIRIVHTSGTTGICKLLLYTRRIHEASIAKLVWAAGLTGRSRYLLALRSAVSGPVGCIRTGGTVIIEDRTTVAEAIGAHGITHTTLPPQFLKRVLGELPKNFVKPADLTVISFGATISPALRKRALAHLVTDLCDFYAANEVDTISSIRGSAEIGIVYPGVRVEVIDEHDHPLPLGEAGQIRVQTNCMLHAYLDDPEETRRFFKDGWFYTGDIGILHDMRRLQVIGRRDDVLNIGGWKIAPEVIEDLILKTGEVGDAGVCSISNADGIEEICVAVSHPRCGDEELLRRITDAFRARHFGRIFHVIKLSAIPRTANGKLQRKALKAIAATAQAQPQGPEPIRRSPGTP
ncbi:MAG: class I adenylate-forming enzyme family protein [Bradyrhizobium sp.]